MPCQSSPGVLRIDPQDVFLKVRRHSKGGSQYASEEEKAGVTGITAENGLLFEVNLSDYLDTGLFLDHRTTRALVGKMAEGKRFLNLFAYTGTATVYAAKGGAASTTTVDLSGPYLTWAERNMDLNGIDTGEESTNLFIKSDVMSWLRSQRQQRNRWDLIFVDPPTFSNSTDAPDWDVEKDYVELLINCSRLLTRNGQIVFSCNKRGFQARFRRPAQGRRPSREITPQDHPRGL